MVSIRSASIWSAIAAAVTIASAPVAAQTVIDFETGTEGAAIGNFYAAQGVTFANAGFGANFRSAGTSGLLGLIAGDGSYLFGADNAIVGTFANTASRVGIRAADVGSAGARLEAYSAANVLLGFSENFGTDVGADEFFDLSVTATGIASFRLFQPGTVAGDNLDAEGVIFDDLSFTTPSVTAPVPEPASWALTIGGFGLVGGALRRRRAVTTRVRFA